MTNRKSRGFTLIEMVIVIGVLSIFATLTLPPLVDALRLVNRETAMINMDQAANKALNLVTASLRQAILPVKIFDADNREVTISDSAILSDINEYIQDTQIAALSLSRFMNNASVGFGRHGRAWLDILQGGTDFLPFTVPVDYRYDDGTSSVTTLDTTMLPQLGIFMNSGEMPNAAVEYEPFETLVNGNIPTYNRLLWWTRNSDVANANATPFVPPGDIDVVSSIHPFLSSLNPGDFGLSPAGPPALLDMTAPRYGVVLALPAGANQAYGVIRFVPFRDNAGNVHRLNEGPGFDLNEDGVLTDSYVLGRIEISYFPAGGGRAQTTVASSNTVLLQLNTDSESYRPLFALRRQKAGGYVIDITLLMCDDLTQQGNVLAFNRGGRFLARKYTSSVELRNMKLK